jgi:hypothetical protein
MKNKMTDLRNHLFETLEALKDKVLINSAKVEIQFLEAINSGDTSEFFGSERLKSRTDRPNLRLANGAR